LIDLGVTEEALLIVTSNHAEEFWDHGGYEHGHSLHGELVRIPLIVRGPGIPSQRIHTPVYHVDLFAGVVNRIGARLPAVCQGDDLFEIAIRERSGAIRERPILTEGQLYTEPQVAVTEGRDRLVLKRDRACTR
jgi:arylsulfatase A-like enzyme